MILFTNNARAQTTHLLPPYQPEQDACNAVALCRRNFYTPYSYSGVGRKLDLVSTPCFPSTGGGEINSVWFKLVIDALGTLAFKIKPVTVTDDYDFALADITKASCNLITQDNVVRCNFEPNLHGNIDSGYNRVE